MSTKKFGILTGMILTLSVVVSPAFAACSLTTLSECDNNGLMALVLQLLAGQQTGTGTGTGTTISGIPAGFTFTTNLKQGSTGTDVKYLQILLNSDSATSIGNAGKETTYFGAATKAGVVKFQNKYANEVLKPYGLTAGTGIFGSASRAEANELIAAGVGTGTGTGTGPVVTGGFTVALATDNPAASTLVQGQATADLAHYTFSNGTSTPITVTGVTLNRTGVSADATLSSVYLFDGSTRLTDAASVSAGQVTFNLSSGIFTIPANSTKTIAVKSDILSTANGQTVGVSLAAVASNGTLNTTLPIAGNISTIASATLATVVVGTALPSSNTTTDPIAGVRVWEAPFTVGNRNVTFTKLALKQINSIDKADISNFQLLVDGAVVSTVASLDSNGYVTFTFNKVLTTGTRNVKVLADVTGGSSRYIQMSLRNKADIDVKDADYGVNVAATGIPATTGTIQVNQGVFTIAAKNSALPVTVSNNSSNVLIGKWTFKASGEAVKVETLTAGFTYTDAGGSVVNAAATLRNGKIMINGVQAGSTTTLAPAGTQYTVNYTFQPGVETTVELYADIYDNDGTGSIEASDTIQATLVRGVGNGTRQVSLGTIDVPTTAQAAATVASTITVSTGSATLVATPSYGNQNTVLPQTAFKIGSWTLTAGTAEDLNINSLSFAIAAVSGANFTVGDMSDMYVTYQIGSGSAVTTSVTSTPTTPAVFSTSFTLPKAQTVTINLYASLNDNADPSAIIATNSVRATLTVSATGSQSGSAASISGTGVGQTIIASTASLTISKSASTPVSSLVVGGNTVKTVTYKFETANDSYTISQLVFSLAGTNGTTAVQTVNLKDGSTIIGTAPSASSVTFNLATPITIAANTSKTLDVEVVLGTIGVGAGSTGADVVTDLTNALVRPASTGTAGYTGDTAASGNDIYVYKAVPTITLSTLPSGNLVSGTNTISKFTLGTDTGTVAWKRIVFTVAKSDASGSDLGAITAATLWNGSTQVTGTAVIASALASNGSQSGTIVFIPTNEEQVSGSATYSLNVDVGGTVATSDSVTAKIANPSTTFTASNKAFAFGTAAGTTALAYSDEDAGGTVTAGDVRQTAASKYTTVDVTAATDTTGHNASAKISQAYGITGDIVLTLAEGATDNQAAAATFTVTGAGATGLTCTPYTGVDGTGAFSTGGVFNTIQSVVCTGTGMGLKILSLTVTNDTGTNTGNGGLVITITKAADYATNTVVASGNSDLNIALTAGVPASASFDWSDLSAQSHSISTSDWTTDYLVKNLPTNTQAVSK